MISENAGVESHSRVMSVDEAREALTAALSHPPAGRVPPSTYRVQWGARFGFEHLARRAAYLRRLGATDVYASPFLHARSAHGYDVNDHGRVNPALGDDAAFEAMLAALRGENLGLVVDVVPNHMGIAGGENAWWNDVLENGPASPYAAYFDVDWQPLKTEMANQVLLPTLGDQYGRVLERGELRLEYDAGAFAIAYYDVRLPVSPDTYAPILELALEELRAAAPADDDAVVELQSILTAISHLPPSSTTGEDSVRERAREKEVVKRRLNALVQASAAARAALSAAVAAFNGSPGNTRSYDRLDALIHAQPYRLSYWRVAAEEINYRRFFDVNELAAIRVERDEVFRATHRLIMDLVGRGLVTGIRVDHPDGLWDPARYFVQLQRGATLAWARAALEAERGPLSDADAAVLDLAADDLVAAIARAKPLYVVAEKIVEHGEDVPEDWAVHGTTGYEFLNLVNGLFVDGSSAKALTDAYERFVGHRPRFADMVHDMKRLILRTALASELNVLAHALNRVSERNRHYRDFTLGNLTLALRETIAAFPVYRSYVTERTERVDDHDRAAVDAAVRAARRRNPDLDPSVFEFLRSLLLLETADLDAEGVRLARDFVMRFQQLTGPVMAKGVEDTVFYRYNRLVALNEVGGDPLAFGVTPGAFHRANLERLERWPHAMLTTSTHDTKRSEDVRARTDVISEFPDEWRAAVARWSRLNRSRRVTLEGGPALSRDDEYLVYQTLVGVWPLDARGREAPADLADRVVQYALKSARESKARTSWVNQDLAYEGALEHFIRATLADRRFLEDLARFRATLERFGALNSLAQAALKYASPGVPDTYQGQESWDFSLVDPDNRRPVDFDALHANLEDLERRAAVDARGVAAEVTGAWRDGRVKLWLTHRALTHRRDHPRLYARGSYRPLDAEGPGAERVVAFMRECDDARLVVIVPRLLARAAAPGDALPVEASAWAGTVVPVPPGRYRHVFTGEVVDSDGSLEVSAAFAAFPVAFLEREVSA